MMRIKNLDQAAKSIGIIVESKTMQDPKSLKHHTSPKEVPRMYRAQVDGRCTLMFAGKNKEDLKDWSKQWIDPHPEEPRYQKKELPLGLDGTIYRIKVKFPFRLWSNCGQDNIIRPIIGKNGIPYLSGSSVKGIFRRVCNDVQVKKYCGDAQDLEPSSLGFRFHGAYPIGDWSGMRKVEIWKDGEQKTEIRYRMLDVVHPQQERQLGTDKQRNATALASVSLFQPTLIFEFSSANPDIDWKEVETIFWKAIDRGVGGKTSTGYGFGGHNDKRPAIVKPGDAYVMLIGQGVSPTLRSGEAEFRPNLFKASLRGHSQRLLAGVIGNREDLDKEINRLFGSSSRPGILQLFWEQKGEVQYGQLGGTQTFKAEGKLHINAANLGDVDQIENALKFAFVMGGFGKSWRRASHEKFHKAYKKFEIGCHWELSPVDRSWLSLKSIPELKSFLDEIYQYYRTQFGNGQANSLDWREAWHPDRLSVYAVITIESKAIGLFHDDTYKKTPAIGGRILEKEFNPKKQKMEDKEKLLVSHVWHRMLPIKEESFLEIVTVFHTEREKWDHPKEGDQLDKFIKSLQNKGLSLVWGRTTSLPKPPKKTII